MFGGRSLSGDAPLDSISTLVSGPSCGKNSDSRFTMFNGGRSSIIISYILQLRARVWPSIFLYVIHMTLPQPAIGDINDICQWSYFFNNDSWYPGRPRAKVFSHHRLTHNKFPLPSMLVISIFLLGLLPTNLSLHIWSQEMPFSTQTPTHQ